jgi:hypothetical protein
MVVGVAAGVILVQTEQIFKNKAAELQEHKVSICHKTGSDSNPWVQIEVSENALEAHMAHGDINGSCPSGSGGTSGGGGNSGGGNTTNSSSSTTNNITVINNPSYSQPEPSPVIKYVYITTIFDFLNSLFGINKKEENINTRVIFETEGQELHVYNKVVESSDPKGIYKGTITDIRPGTFKVSVKPDYYLQKIFRDILVKKGANKYTWTSSAFIPGDFDNNNILEGKDIAELLSIVSVNDYPNLQDKLIFDTDKSGGVDIDDVNLVLLSYMDLKVKGEE